MPEANRKKAVKELKANGVGFVLYFPYDDTQVRRKDIRKVAQHIEFMQDNPTVRLRLEGHTDAGLHY
jgi:peptidoglycan-associated lipoprotein